MIAGTLEGADGVALAYERWPGSDDHHALFLHATGMCKELWRPVLRALHDGGVSVTCTAVDQRAHGDSAASPPNHWAVLGDDAAVAAAACGRPLIGVGHSMGGAALCMAESALPGTFAGLVLIEPVVFPPPYGRADDNPLTLGALRRRPAFPSRRDARRNFAGAGPFARWTAEALDLYVEHAFRDGAGDRVLKCAPEAEAEFYREGLDHDTWDRLDMIACPVVIVGGEASTTHGRPFVDRLAARFPHAVATVVAGAGHFVPMEDPQSVAAAITRVMR